MLLARVALVAAALSAAACSSDPECTGRAVRSCTNDVFTSGVQVCHEGTLSACVGYTDCNPLAQDCDVGACYAGGSGGSFCIDASEHPCEPGERAMYDADDRAVCHRHCDYAAYPDVNDPDNCESYEQCNHIDEVDGVGTCTSESD